MGSDCCIFFPKNVFLKKLLLIIPIRKPGSVSNFTLRLKNCIQFRSVVMTKIRFYFIFSFISKMVWTLHLPTPFTSHDHIASVQRSNQIWWCCGAFHIQALQSSLSFLQEVNDCGCFTVVKIVQDKCSNATLPFTDVPINNNSYTIDHYCPLLVWWSV